MTNVRFEDVMKSGNLLQAIVKKVPFEHCTKLQAAAMGHILANRDVYV